MFWLLCKNNSEHDKTGETQGFQPDTDFKLTLHLPLTQNHLTMLRICNLLHTVWHFHCFVLLMIYFLQKYLEHLSHTWRNKIQLTSTCIGFKACLEPGRNQGWFTDNATLDKRGRSSSPEAVFIMLSSMATYVLLWNSATPAILTHPSLMCLHSYQYQHVTAYVCTRREKCTLNTATKHVCLALACSRIKF